jgi:diguanylate cyclase (GGDEF)-like protein
MELSKVIKGDPALSAQVLKAINCPYYALARQVGSVDRAVSFMGIRAVRNLVLCFGVRELTPQRSPYPLEMFWEASLRRAAAAKLLAQRKGVPEAEELFTLGLCQDIGVLVMLRQSPAVAEALAGAVRQPAADRLVAERETAGEGHDELAYRMFQEWNFPENFREAVRYHHRVAAAPEEFSMAARVLYLAEDLADLAFVDDKREAIERTQTRLERHLSFQPDQINELVNELGEAVEAAAEMLDIKVGPQPDFEKIAIEAAQGLLALNMSYQNLTQELERSLAQQQRMAEQLQSMNEELARRAGTDELTGLANRRAFDARLDQELERARRLSQPLGICVIDVDHFKRFNDTYGHLAGDVVLREVAQSVQSCIRGCDFAARFGGEEFVVLCPHTDREGTLVAAERLRQTIEAMVAEYEGKSLRVTASVGVTVITDSKDSRAGTMAFRRADDALYQAKDAGRNRVAFR